MPYEAKTLGVRHTSVMRVNDEVLNQISIPLKCYCITLGIQKQKININLKENGEKITLRLILQKRFACVGFKQQYLQVEVNTSYYYCNCKFVFGPIYYNHTTILIANNEKYAVHM